MTTPLDALGNEIVLGNYYGFSSSSNGITHLVFGEAINITEKGKVTLNLFYRTFFGTGTTDLSLITNDIGRSGVNTKSSVTPCRVFPINRDDFNRNI